MTEYSVFGQPKNGQPNEYTLFMTYYYLLCLSVQSQAYSAGQ